MALGLNRNIRLYDESGTAYGVKHIDNKPRVSAMPYLLDIAEGNVSEHTAVRRFGHNTAASQVWETISGINALKPYPASAAIVKAVSTDGNDDGDPADNGARTVTIFGLDADYAEVSETVTMNGTNAVATTQTFLRLCRAKVITAGATGYNEGTISIKNNAEDETYLVINPQENRSHSACYTVRPDNTLYIVHWEGSESSTKGVEIALWVREFGGLFELRRMKVILDNPYDDDLPVAEEPITEKSDVEIRVKGVLTGANVSGGFSGWTETS